MFAGESVRHELPLFKMPFSKMMSSPFRFHPDNCPINKMKKERKRIRNEIDMQIERKEEEENAI